jgi:hypothetical protein
MRSGDTGDKKMKSNRDLGYEPLYGEAGQQLGAEKSWENDYTYVSTLSLHVTIGRRGAEYRVYGLYLPQ